MKGHWSWMAVAFTLCAVLVFGGLSWATVVSLRLRAAETRYQDDNELGHRLGRALWRMDSSINAVLAVENSREFGHYKHAYCSTTSGCIGPSPIITDREGGKIPTWILGHFMLSQMDGWQVPKSYSYIDVDEAGETLPGRLTPTGENRTPWFDNLSSRFTIEDVKREIAGMGWFYKASGFFSGDEDALGDKLPLAGNGSQSSGAAQSGAGSAPDEGSAPDSNDLLASFKEFAQRAAQRRILRALGGTWGEICEPRDVAMSGLFGDAMGLSDDSSEEGEQDISVHMTDLLPVWLAPSSNEMVLAYVRKVEVAGEWIYQGFVVDWNRLSAELLTSVRSDLFPNAKIVPIRSEPDQDRECMMNTVPALLDVEATPTAMAATSRTVLYGSLTAIWVSALSVFAAVVIGIRNLISFAERRLQFAYDVTHELRTPLTTMRLYTDMLSSGVIEDEGTRQEYLHTLDRETERLSGLVAGVLEYARVENHSVKLENSSSTLGEIIHETETRWAPYCEREGQEFSAEVNGLASTKLQTDRRLVQQVLDILVDNACKYGRTEKDPRVMVRALRVPDGRVAIEVQDNGPGVASRDRKSIFRPFKRGSVIEIGGTIPSGIGLGLALARRWAKMLGGRVECVRSDHLLKGACFRLTLPQKAHVN